MTRPADPPPAGPPHDGRRAAGHPHEAPAPGERGQAAVELVALLPLLVTVALAAGHGLAAGAAYEVAGHAAEAAAIALLRGGDPEAAARASVPAWSRKRLDVRVRDRTVSVRVEPLAAVPALADLLAATATADLGPEHAG